MRHAMLDLAGWLVLFGVLFVLFLGVLWSAIVGVIWLIEWAKRGEGRRDFDPSSVIDKHENDFQRWGRNGR